MPRLAVNASTLPRLQMAGTLLIALLIVLGMGVYFITGHQQRLSEGIAAAERRALDQHQRMLEHEAKAVIGTLDHVAVRAGGELRRQVREQTDQGLAIAQAIYDREHGRRPEAEVKRLIIEALRPVRFFGGRGYYFIDDLAGKCILLPTVPALEGTSLWDNRDPTGHYIMRGLLEAVKTPERAGYSSYRWYPPGEERVMREKVAYVRVFEPYGWVIGTGEYLYQIEADLRRQALDEIAMRRFGDGGYVAVLSWEGTVLVAPGAPDHVGKQVKDLAEPGRSVVSRILQTAFDGAKVVIYDWVRPGTESPVRKMAYVEVHEPWGWVVVATSHLDEIDQAVAAERQALEADLSEQRNVTLAALAAAILASLVFSSVFGRRLAVIVRHHQADLEERNRQLAENARELRLSARVFECANEAIVITDADNRIVAVNPSFTRVTGYGADEVLGASPSVFSSHRHDQAFYKAMWDDLRSKGRWIGEIWNRRRDGTVYPEWLSISVVCGSDGVVENYVATFSDMSSRKLAEDKIRELAFYDPLTGLPNRRLLRDRLEQAQAASARTGLHGALLFVDLDNFKTLNDTRGHDVGDQLLVQVAQRLQGAVREGDTVARLGGDEFVVVLNALSPDEDAAAALAERVGDKMVQILNQPYALDSQPHHSTPSIGVSLFRGHDISVDEALKRADTAMYGAKDGGRNRLCFFDPAMQRALETRAKMEVQLREALALGQFVMHYQPQVDASGAVHGAEALVRWVHPDRGMLGPGLFISLAEETGLILPLGRWVMEQACRQLRQWNRAWPDLCIAVNVSALQFQQADFIDDVHRILAETGANPSCLKLELTESLILKDVDQVVDRMLRLRSLGVRFSIDDFGTGQSSLSYLKRLPLDQLKIDQSFVRDITTDPNDAIIVRTIIAMSQSMGLALIAEGVELPEQRDFLRDHGCGFYQGYLFGRPMDAQAFEALLVSGGSEPRS